MSRQEALVEDRLHELTLLSSVAISQFVHEKRIYIYLHETNKARANMEFLVSDFVAFSNVKNDKVTFEASHYRV